MAARTDDNMIVQNYVQSPRRFGQIAREADVLLARGRIAARVVVDDDECGRAERQRASDDVANIDRGSSTDPSLTCRSR